MYWWPVRPHCLIKMAAACCACSAVGLSLAFQLNTQWSIGSLDLTASCDSAIISSVCDFKSSVKKFTASLKMHFSILFDSSGSVMYSQSPATRADLPLLFLVLGIFLAIMANDFCRAVFLYSGGFQSARPSIPHPARRHFHCAGA